MDPVSAELRAVAARIRNIRKSAKRKRARSMKRENAA